MPRSIVPCSPRGGGSPLLLVAVVGDCPAGANPLSVLEIAGMASDWVLSAGERTRVGWHVGEGAVSGCKGDDLVLWCWCFIGTRLFLVVVVVDGRGRRLCHGLTL